MREMRQVRVFEESQSRRDGNRFHTRDHRHQPQGRSKFQQFPVLGRSPASYLVSERKAFNARFQVLVKSLSMKKFQLCVFLVVFLLLDWKKMCYYLIDFI